MDKIAQAVNEFQKVIKADRPFGQVKTFIDKLKADPAWTDADIVEVQTRIIRTLMRKLDQKS